MTSTPDASAALVIVAVTGTKLPAPARIADARSSTPAPTKATSSLSAVRPCPNSVSTRNVSPLAPVGTCNPMVAAYPLVVGLSGVHATGTGGSSKKSRSARCPAESVSSPSCTWAPALSRAVAAGPPVDHRGVDHVQQGDRRTGGGLRRREQAHRGVGRRDVRGQDGGPHEQLAPGGRGPGPRVEHRRQLRLGAGPQVDPYVDGHGCRAWAPVPDNAAGGSHGGLGVESQTGRQSADRLDDLDGRRLPLEHVGAGEHAPTAGRDDEPPTRHVPARGHDGQLGQPVRVGHGNPVDGRRPRPQRLLENLRHGRAYTVGSHGLSGKRSRIHVRDDDDVAVDSQRQVTRPGDQIRRNTLCAGEVARRLHRKEDRARRVAVRLELDVEGPDDRGVRQGRRAVGGIRHAVPGTQ